MVDDANLVLELERHRAELEAQNEELFTMNQELHRVNAALTVARDRYQILYDSAPLPCVTIDRSCTIVQANHAATTMLDLGPAAAGKARLDVLVMPSSLTSFRAFIAAAFEGRATSGEVEIEIADEARCVIFEGASLSNDSAPAVHCLCTIVDLTVRKRAEEAQRALDRRVQHVQKLESLGVLAGGVAHDFNNLLMVISGNLEVAQTELPAESPVSSMLADALVAAEHAAKLSRQMLMYTGRSAAVTRTIELVTMLRGLEPLIRAAAKASVLRLEIDGDVHVEGDSTQLCQLVLNLVTNASEAGASQILVTLAEIQIDATELGRLELDYQLPPGRYAILEVIDNGPGMSEETRRRIFDPFFTTKFSGRGLGLAVVHGAARSHHGGLAVVSKLGVGTTFTVYLPTCGKAVSVAPPTAQLPIRLTGRVLIIDDNLAVARTLKLLIEALGMTATLAHGGQAALDLAATADFAVALVDFMMPDMNGLECAAQLRALRPTMPLVLSTGYDTVPPEAESIFDGVLTKPYDQQALVPMLVRVMRRR